MTELKLPERLIHELQQRANEAKLGLADYIESCLHDHLLMQAKIDALEEREARLRLLTDNVSDLVCLHEPDGKYLYLNPAIEQITGHKPEELIGKNPYDYFNPADLAAIQASHQSSLSGKLVPSVVYRYRCKDGRYVWMESSTRPILNEQGVILHLVTVSRDVTERKHFEDELRNERDLLQSIMETSPSGIIVADKNGQIIFSNRRSDEILGRPKQQLKEMTYDATDFKHTDYEGNPWPDEKQPFVRVLQSKAPVWDVRHAIEWPDGQRVYLAINGAPILDEQGEVSKVIFTVEDYTQRKLQQDELEAALEREKQLNAMKSDFLSIVTHEFRTPMSVITSSTGLLRLKHQNMNSQQIIERLRRIEGQVERLDLIMRDVTFINKTQRAKHLLNPETIDLAAFFEEVKLELAVVYPKKGAIEITGTVPELFLDEAMLHHIFLNLLSNALKYSPDNSHVTVDILLQGASFEVKICDKGIGIPQKDQAQLFDLFHRAGNVGSIEGTGLGLAIAKQAVDLLQGTINCESTEGVGTCFTVILPLAMELPMEIQ